jgi:eukaryotic-like serine/threonine-protein kinase
LGVVTYQLISGRLPYEANSLTELALKQQRERPPTLDELVAAVSPELADAVAKALALDPESRYQTALQMRHALGDGMRGVAPEEPPPRSQAQPFTEATRALSSERTHPPERSERTRPPERAGTRRTGSTRVVAPRQPRPGRRSRAAADQPASAPAPSPRRARRSSGRRLLLALLGLLALALAVIAVVLITAPSSTRVTLRKVVYHDVQQASSALRQLVSENTK